MKSNTRYYLQLLVGVAIGYLAAEIFSDPDGYGLIPWIIGGFIVALLLKF